CPKLIAPSVSPLRSDFGYGRPCPRPSVQAPPFARLAQDEELHRLCGCPARRKKGRKKQWVPDALSFSRHVESYISHQKTDFAYPHERWSGTLSTIGEACEYMAAIGKERELRPHWQRVRELMLQEADVAAFSSRVRLAVLKDAKLDMTALSEPIERWMDEPLSGLLSDGKLNVVEKDEPPKEPTESNDRSDGDSEEERRRLEELQRAEARRAAEEKRRREEAKNEPFWNRFLAMLRARDS